MNIEDFIKAAWPKLIEATNDPLSPIKLNEAYKSVNRVGDMLASSTNLDAVEETCDMLLQAWSDEEVEELSAKPEFIIALGGLFNQALISYGRKIANESQNNNRV